MMHFISFYNVSKINDIYYFIQPRLSVKAWEEFWFSMFAHFAAGRDFETLNKEVEQTFTELDAFISLGE